MSGRVSTVLALTVIAGGLLGAQLTRPKPTASLPTGPALVACEQLPLSASFQRANLILSGSVFAVTPGRDGLADVLITPNDIYKGTPPATGIVLAAFPTTSAGQTDSLGSLHFTSDDPPYFLVLRARADGRFDTSRCDGSRLLGAGLTREEHDALGQ